MGPSYVAGEVPSNGDACRLAFSGQPRGFVAPLLVGPSRAVRRQRPLGRHSSCGDLQDLASISSTSR